MGMISSLGKVLVGVDTEWNFADGTSDVTQILQLSFPGCPVAVIHLGAMFAISPDSFPT